MGRKNDENNHFISTSEIILSTPIALSTAMAESTPIAMSTAMAESEWKRELDEVSQVFKTWKKYPQEAELNWWFYSGRMGIRRKVTKHSWEDKHNNTKGLWRPKLQKLKTKNQ